MKLTETKLRSLKPKAKPYQVADGHGLSIEIHPGGALAWVYRYRWAGRAQAVRLGRYPEISLAEAREKRLEASRLREKGKSPATEKRVSKAAVSEQATVEQFARLYLDDMVARSRKDPRQMERYFRREIFPALAHLPMAEVTPQHVLAIADRMKHRGVPMAALDVRNLLKRFFDYAMVRRVVTFNPAAAVPRRMVATPRSRERVLSSDEIKKCLTTLYASNTSRSNKLALHLILITLVRKSELLMAKWVDVNFKTAEWAIPAANAKTGKPRIVYLSQQANALFQELHALSEGSEHVIPGRNKPWQATSKTVLNSALRSLSFDIEHFTIHDFRRTASTQLHELGWNSDVIEKALGHEIGGVRGIYNRAEYAEQRRKMLQDWADRVDSLVTERSVVMANFRRAA